MKPYLTESIRGGEVLVLENFTFSKQKILKSGETFWRCCKRNSKCSAKLFTVGEELTVSRSELNHNHDSDEIKVIRKNISNSCKRKAEEDLSEQPSKIIRKVLSVDLPKNISSDDVGLIRKSMYHARRKSFPSVLPKNIDEVHNVIKLYAPTTSRQENFIFINDPDSHIIVFTCKTNIDLMLTMDIFYMDGTFSFCTKFFLQLFTIHGQKNGHYVPLIFCLLPDKNKNTYSKLFLGLINQITTNFGLNWNPKEVYADFEIGIHLALKNVWPDVKISGCRFHLHQAWYRKVQSLGLVAEYKNQSEIGKWIKDTLGLTYLKPEDVEECFVFDIMSYKPLDSKLDMYADYLLENYIGETASFKPHIWADQTPSISRTTNCCESFHSKFNSSFYNTHPSIYIFIEKLKEFQIDSYIKLQSLQKPAKIKDRSVKSKLTALENLVGKFEALQISRLEYVKAVSYYSKLG